MSGEYAWGEVPEAGGKRVQSLERDARGPFGFIGRAHGLARKDAPQTNDNAGLARNFEIEFGRNMAGAGLKSAEASCAVTAYVWTRISGKNLSKNEAPAAAPGEREGRALVAVD
jgi:hypothetical protein